MPSEPRYERRHSGDWVCLDCGCLVVEKEAHTRFHSILSSHAWTLAVLKVAHLADHIHAKYEVADRINSKKFDNWSADALAEVVAEMDGVEDAHRDGSKISEEGRVGNHGEPDEQRVSLPGDLTRQDRGPSSELHNDGDDVTCDICGHWHPMGTHIDGSPGA